MIGLFWLVEDGQIVATIQGEKRAIYIRDKYWPNAQIHSYTSNYPENKYNPWQDDFYYAPDPHPYSQSAINDAINEYYGTTGDNLEAIFDEADGYGYEWGFYDGYDIDNDLLR